MRFHECSRRMWLTRIGILIVLRTRRLIATCMREIRWHLWRSTRTYFSRLAGVCDQTCLVSSDLPSAVEPRGFVLLEGSKAVMACWSILRKYEFFRSCVSLLFDRLGYFISHVDAQLFGLSCITSLLHETVQWCLLTSARKHVQMSSALRTISRG